MEAQDKYLDQNNVARAMYFRWLRNIFNGGTTVYSSLVLL